MGSGSTPLIPLATAFRQLLAILDRLEIPFLVGGSVASGSYGLPRQTNDIDILADFRNTDVDALCELLAGEFYVSLQTVREAIRNSRAFNVIHLNGAFKFDLFPAADEFARSELVRRRLMTSTLPGLESLEFPLASAEDTVLAKLRWFRRGGETSEHQWHDILGVLNVQAGRLDLPYLRLWAARLEIADLLDRALSRLSRAC